MKKVFLVVLTGFMLFAANAFATSVTLEFVSVDPGQHVYGNFGSLGKLTALAGSYVNRINGIETYTYCVEFEYAPSVGSPKTYQLLDLPNNEKYLRAAWIMQNYLPEDITADARVNAQVAIWEIISDDPGTLESGNFWANAWIGDGSLAGAQSIVNAVLGLTSYDGVEKANFKLAKLDIPGKNKYQDYLIYAPVPEPATMLLLGFGLVGLAVIGRRNFIKK